MKPKISIVTLGVKDHAKAKKFYEEGMGLAPEDASNDDITFYDMNGTWLSLYPDAKLAEDIGIEVGKREGFSGVTIAHNVGSEEEVDKVLSRAREAGAVIVKEGQKVFWGGYSGYFKDPDAHLWEVAYNPFKDLT